MNPKKPIYRQLLTFILLILPALALTLSSCKEGPKYGHLDGMWQIMSITTDEGEQIEIPGRRYFGFQRNVVQLRTENGVAEGLTGNLYYNEEDRLLSLDFPNRVDMKNPQILEEWGIFSTQVYFVVEELTSSRLVMRIINPEINANGTTPAGNSGNNADLNANGDIPYQGNNATYVCRKF